jgi:hypothetical protein
MDIEADRAWGVAMGIMGRSLYSGQNGQTMGCTVGNSSGSIAIQNTQAGSNTSPNASFAGLGGIFQMTAASGSAGVSSDFIIQYYQNPASTINITGRNMVITGFKASACNYGATVATTPTTLIWYLGYGMLTNTEAAAETGSFTTATTHAPRRVSLGMSTVPVGAIAGALYTPDIQMDFSSAPIVVRPGEYLHTTVRTIVGTATASQTIIATIGFTGYFE